MSACWGDASSQDLYHVSKVDLGDFVTLTARVPPSATDGECQIQDRVCFGTSILGALCGQAGCPDPDDFQGLSRHYAVKTHFLDLCDGLLLNPTVYVPISVAGLVARPEIYDYHLTGEHWSLHDTPCRRLGYVSLAALYQGSIVIVQTPMDPFDGDPLDYMSPTTERPTVEYPEPSLEFRLAAANYS